MLEVINVSKNFKDQTVFEDVTIKMEHGKIYGFVGHNGSGKSVLFKIIAGFIKASKGKVIYDGQIIGKEVDFIQGLGVIIETPGFIENFSGFDNLKYLASIKNVISNEQIVEALQLVGLDPFDKKQVKKYSLGMRQRLAIAQAVMEDQKVLIFDEIFNGLDKSGREDIKGLITDLKSAGKLILLTSHIEGDIEDLADEIYEFDAQTLTRI